MPLKSWPTLYKPEDKIMAKLSNKKAKKKALNLASKEVRKAKVSSKKKKVIKLAANAAFKPVKKGKNNKAKKAVRKVIKKKAA